LLAEVREAHRRAMAPAWEVDPPAAATDAESPGNWRQHAIQPFAGGMQPAAHTEIQAHMTDWVARVNAIRTEPPPEVQIFGNIEVRVVVPPIAERVARLHAEFERNRLRALPG